MSAQSWSASYRVWRETYDNPYDLARAVVREQITRVLEHMGDQNKLELSTEDQPDLQGDNN